MRWLSRPRCLLLSLMTWVSSPGPRGQNWLWKVIIWPTHMGPGMFSHVCVCMCTHVPINKIKIKKEFQIMYVNASPSRKKHTNPHSLSKNKVVEKKKCYFTVEKPDKSSTKRWKAMTSPVLILCPFDTTWPLHPQKLKDPVSTWPKQQGKFQ